MMTQAQWVDAFAMHMSRLGVRAVPDLLVDMAEELWSEWGQVDPVTVAQAEYDEWPPHDD